MPQSPTSASEFVAQSPLLSMLREVQGSFTPADGEQVANQLVKILRDYYVHLPLKKSSLGIDPVQEAHLLIDDIKIIPTQTEFNRRLFFMIKRLRDRHTAIRLPSPWRDMVAYLPFAIESYFDQTGRHVIVSKLMTDVGDPGFVPSAEITHWNGVAIGRYIENFSWTNEGANPFARIAVALRSMTARPLGYMPAPEEDWVTVTYRGASGFRSVTVPWRVYIPPVGSAAAAANITAAGSVALFQGVDRSTLIVNNTWLDLYAGAATQSTAAKAELPNVVSKVVRTSTGEWGYVRVFSFDASDNGSFVTSFARILQQLPASGLIIDLRANPGGSIPAGEGLLGLFTKRKVTPQPVSFRNTASMRRLGQLGAFQSWRRSLDMQLETGEIFSQGFSLTTDESGPRGVYLGPVVLIIDALCYSTTDFFSAGMQDNGLASIIGIDPVTGAGGANVWNHSTVAQFVSQTGGGDLFPLPGGYDIDVSMRRSIRVGLNEGLPVEGLGVFADVGYNPTKQDVLGSNDDLIEFAGRVLSGMKDTFRG